MEKDAQKAMDRAAEEKNGRRNYSCSVTKRAAQQAATLLYPYKRKQLHTVPKEVV